MCVRQNLWPIFTVFAGNRHWPLQIDPECTLGRACALGSERNHRQKYLYDGEQYF